MSRKHKTKHDRRGTSRYPARLLDRGESTSSVRMKFYDYRGREHDTMLAVTRRANEVTGD